MVSGLSIRIVLFLYLCCSWMLIVHAVTKTPFIHNHNLKNIFLRNQYSQPSIKLDSDLMKDSSSLLSFADIKRRNVIMPRICYFARISGTSVHQKLCLPYNDNIR